MKIIKLSLTLFMLLSFFSSHSQEIDKFNVSTLTDTVSKSKDKTEIKFFDTSYDPENIRVRRVNDTLNIFVEGQKKISIVALNIVEMETFPGFEQDVEGFFEMVEKLNLDFDSKSYRIRYSPIKKEIIVSERDEYRFKVFDDLVLPIFRHEIIFTYQVQMLDVSFFLGEIDELKVFKEAGFSEIISKEAGANNWFADYGKTRFNKDLRIDDQGEIQLITYRNIESSRRIDFGYNLGIGFIGNLFPFDQEFALNYRVKGYNKKTQENNGFFVSVNWYSFLSRDESKTFDLSTSLFTNVGFLFGSEKLPVRFYYGRLIHNKEEEDYFRFNKNKFGMDILVNGLIRVKSETFIGSGDNDGVINLGVSISLFGN